MSTGSYGEPPALSAPIAGEDGMRRGALQESGGWASGAAASPWLIAVAVILVSLLALVLFATAFTEWREFRLPDDMNIDLAWFNQGFYRTLHDHRWLIESTVAEMASYSIIGVHFSPILYLVLPLYTLWQSPLMLLLISAFGVATTGIMVILTAWRIFGSSIVAFVWFGIFAVYPAIPLSVQLDGFRELYLAMGFLSLALWFYLEEKHALFFMMLFLAILAKEDIALLAPTWGVVALLQRRGWRLAGATALLGIVYFIFANAVALPLIRGAPLGQVLFVGFPSPLGQTPGGLLHSLRADPGEVIGLLLSGHNLNYWGFRLSPLLFLPVLGWEYLVIPAYLYAEIAFGPRALQVQVRYIAPALPFILVAAQVGALRLIKVVARAPHPSVALATRGRRIVLAVLLCAMTTLAFHFEVSGRTVIGGTPFTPLLGENWPANPGLSQNAALLRVLSGIPPRASVAATLSMVSQISSRHVMYYLAQGSYFSLVTAQKPDYVALDLRDLEGPEIRVLGGLLCGGMYGVVYEDVVYEGNVGGGRMLLARGAALSANPVVSERFVPGPHQPCPAHVQQVLTPGEFTRIARDHVRDRVPSEAGAAAMFVEPVTTLPGNRLAQVIHLPDHTFEPGWYRLDLVGAWPWPSAPASSRATARVLVGERAVGQVTINGDQPLRYATPPFRIDRRGTLPIRVEAEVFVPEGRAGQAWALRPTRAACAIVADAPSLNPRQVTVEALIYLDKMPLRPGADPEAPILSKNSAKGYYLRLVGDPTGKVWVDFNVAGKWSLGQAGVGEVPFHRWTTVAATYDGQKATIYINGYQVPQESSRSSQYAGPIRSQGAPLVIGCQNPGRPDEVMFPGLIASARVWNRILSPQEIQEGTALVGVLPAGGASGLVGSWGFQAVTGGVIPDLSGTGNPITNGGQLTQVPVPELKQPFAAWRARELNLLRHVTVAAVPSARVREQFPSELGTDAMFVEPGAALSSHRFAQVIHLPEHTFAPGWYRVDLRGAWPLPWVPASYRMTARVVVGERTVGQVTGGGEEPLRYTTLPFHIERRETLPIRIQTDVRIPKGVAGQVWALRPARAGCAVVADAASLNPQQVTVEALVYVDEIPPHPGADIELPILSKNNTKGYYLRLAGDPTGKVWVDFSVAGKWAVGQAGVGAVPLHQWTALAATYDGREARIYINGRQALQDPSRSPRYAGTIRSQGAPLAIGCDPQRPDVVAFPGWITAARVWDRALTSHEIEEGEATWPVPAGGASGLVGSWGFQTVAGDMIPDLSDAGNAITNAQQLTRGPAPGVPQPFAAWRVRELDLLRHVTVAAVPEARVREQFPSELGPDAMFPEPIRTVSDDRVAQVIHLPDHNFEPGWYRVDLRGAHPLPWAPASYRVTMRVVVGERTVGQVTGGGEEPLRYTTPPFRIDRRETLPIRVQADVRVPEGVAGEAWALRPARAGCAVVADAASLNSQQVTVEALVYLNELPPQRGAEMELPILSKNNAPGYYLRLIRDGQGKVWADFSVAWKWALGRAGADWVRVHQWAAIAATYDGQEARIYINGRQAPQEPSRDSHFTGVIRSQGAPLVIGCRDPGQPYEVVFPGLIASARVWDRALTAQEIREAEGRWPVPAGGARGVVGSWGFQSMHGGLPPALTTGQTPVTNGTRLTFAPMPGSRQPFAAWGSRELNLLRLVTVRPVKR